MPNELQSPPGQNGSGLAPDANASDIRVAPERSAATLVNGIIADAQRLIGQQWAMFRQEFQGDFRKVWQAALVLGAGVSITVVGSVMLFLMLPLLLHYLVPELPLWACFGIVGGVLAAVGGILALVGVRQIRSYSPLLSQAVKAFKDNFTWTTHAR
jgi:Putative Actinobacterial Holin-X, holin superfamily III